MGFPLEKIYDAISISNNLLFIVPPAIYLATRNPAAAILTVGVSLVGVVSEGLKRTVFSHNLRPAGAKNCDPWCKEGPAAHKPGMPSSHAATAAFAAVYLTMWSRNLLIGIMAAIYWFAICVARYGKHCHTIEQLGVGSLLGGLAAAGAVTGAAKAS